MSGSSRKLIPRFMRPFRIVKVNDNHSLEFQECAGKQTQLVHVNWIKPPYESMIWKEEPCVEFEDNRKEDTSPNLTHELELTAPIEDECLEGNDVELIDLHAEPLASENEESENPCHGLNPTLPDSVDPTPTTILDEEECAYQATPKPPTPITYAIYSTLPEIKRFTGHTCSMWEVTTTVY
ncbi:hypothetical protein OUZ56_003564 [Daphnia magna]|uniref:Uncharacterized protein n=1 Tax=Daphnia magna TaxID=35525 RepID=A0ABR0A9H2_9CRUS|nr:hypothetical protein OUZ56_003564 [Daphnia magna]